MKAPLRIQTLWIGDALSRLERVCLASFVHHGHPVELYTYGEIRGVPPGVRIRDANEIVPSDKVFTYFNGSFAGFADLFRWKLLYDRGGCWIDTDMLCIRPFAFKEDVVFGREIDLAKCVDWTAAVGVLVFPQGHEACKFMLDRCQHPHRFDMRDKPRHILLKAYRRAFTRSIVPVGWGNAGGPIGFRHAIQTFNLHKYEVPSTVFYPVSGAHWRSPFDQTYRDDYLLYSSSHGVHLWNEILRKNYFDKDAPYETGSLMAHYEYMYLGQESRAAA